MISPERIVDTIGKESDTDAFELLKEIVSLSRLAASGQRVLNDRSRISELSRFGTALRACDERLMRLAPLKHGTIAFGIAEAYDPSAVSDELVRVALIQFGLRYLLMHSVTDFSTVTPIEKETFAALSESRETTSYGSYREAAERVCSELRNRMDIRSTGRFFAATTIILCRYPTSEPKGAYDKLLRTAIVERLQHLRREQRPLRVSTLIRSTEDAATRAKWRDGLIEWTMRQSKAPMPDKLYHMCTELTLLSRFVPTSWGISLVEKAVERQSAAFQRNPASGVLAHCAPDRASDIRSEVQTIMTKMGETHRRRQSGNADPDFAFEVYWEFAIACLHYAFSQECDLDWMNRFYVDTAMNAEAAVARARSHRSRSGVPYAPALVRYEEAWYLKRVDRDAMDPLFDDDWYAIADWCRVVLVDHNGIPCRGKNIRNVLIDIEECGSV